MRYALCALRYFVTTNFFVDDTGVLPRKEELGMELFSSPNKRGTLTHEIAD